jgi:hypothetical protein
LVDDANNPTGLGNDLQWALNSGEERCITCGAVFDLRVGSPILSHMSGITVPSHAIVGVGGSEARLEADTLSLTLLPVFDYGAVGLFTAATTAFGLDALFFGSTRHDLIVSEESQKGGLAGSAFTIFEAAEVGADCAVDLHFNLACSLGIHMTVTKEARINARVIDLLNAPAQSGLFGNF